MEGRWGESFPDTFSNETFYTATWRYEDGDWHGSCEASWTREWEDGSGLVERGTFSRTFEESNPPHWPLFNTRSPPAVGEPVDVWLLWDCDIRKEGMYYSGLETSSRWGRVHNADDDQIADENYSDYDTHWDPDTGLVLQWSWSRRMSSGGGVITSTDAPVG